MSQFSIRAKMSAGLIEYRSLNIFHLTQNKVASARRKPKTVIRSAISSSKNHHADVHLSHIIQQLGCKLMCAVYQDVYT